MALVALKNFSVTRDARGVVTLRLDMRGRAYNVLNEETLSELQMLVDALERDPAIRLAIFRSAKESGFCAGADLREIYAIRSPQTADQMVTIGQKLFARIERLPAPTVAAIHGPCLGGGLELAMACRYRLARDDDRTQFGLPEVQLGLLSAWGGTQRLPELVGLNAALRMLLRGRKISARQAARLGLVDRLWPPEQFAAGVEQFVTGLLNQVGGAGRAGRVARPEALRRAWMARRRTRATPIEDSGRATRVVHRPEFADEAVLRAAHRRIARRGRDAPELPAILRAVQRGVYRGRAAGMAAERQAFPELIFSPQCRTLLQKFFHRKRPEKWNAWVDGLTIGAVLRQTARRFPTRDAMIFCQAGVRMTWAEIDRAVDRAARGLLALGLRRGDHFGVWSTNWPEWVILQYATARIGVVLTTINPAYRPAELEYVLAQSEVRGLALIQRHKTSDYFAMLHEVCPGLDGFAPGRLHSAQFLHFQYILCLRGEASPGMITWQELEDAGRTIPIGRLEETERQLDPGDPINLQYTSGTTGPPKGALLSHRNLLVNAFFAGQGQGLDEHDRICIPVPLYHCFGCVLGTMCAAVHGSAMVFPRESFDAEAALEAVEAERSTAIYGVPAMFITELQHPSFPRRDLSSLRTGIMAGSPCPIEIMKRVVHEMGAREITIAYGQTEASPLATMTRVDDPIEKRVGTVGRPLPGIEVKIIDMVTGETLPDGQSGELCCRGHNVMLGYYNMPDATAKAIDAEGWLHTGDLGLKQPDGYFRITGRIKEIIIRGGENVAPREIEELLYQHPKVEQVAVVGVPDCRLGEEILAAIKLRAGESATEDEIRNYCRARLAYFKTPRYIKFTDAFPMTVTGKVQKYKIRRQAIEELGLEAAAAVETA